MGYLVKWFYLKGTRNILLFVKRDTMDNRISFIRQEQDTAQRQSYNMSLRISNGMKGAEELPPTGSFTFTEPVKARKRQLSGHIDSPQRIMVPNNFPS